MVSGDVEWVVGGEMTAVASGAEPSAAGGVKRQNGM